MTIYFAGSSVAELTLNTSGVAGSVGANKNSRVQEYISINTFGGNYIDFGAHLMEGWISWVQTSGTSTSTTMRDFFTLFDTDYSLVNPLFKIQGVNNTVFSYYSGSAFVASPSWGADLLESVGAPVKYDVHFKIANTGGIFRLYRNGVLIGTAGIDDTLQVATTGINRLGIATGGNQTTNWSEIIVANEDTRAMQLHQVLPTGNGTYSDWTGDYTAVDEIGASDADLITTTTLDAKETYTFPSLDAGIANLGLSAVIVSGRVQGGMTSPKNIKGLARLGGVDYEASPQQATPSAWGPTQFIFPTNPATGTTWIGSQLNGAEFGVKAVA